MKDPFDTSVNEYPHILRGFLINVKFKNGHVGEMQLKIEVMRDLGEKPTKLPDFLYERYRFTQEERRIANEIIMEFDLNKRRREKQKEAIELPMGQVVKEHDLYEIKRSIENDASPERLALRDKIGKLQVELYRFTWNEYLKTQPKTLQ